MRIQMKNYYDNSWKSNKNAVYCGRPSPYGNPFTVKEHGLDECLRLYRTYLELKLKENPKFLEPLRGKDLVCFCSLTSKCHCDIIIEFLERK
jgi:hypothetical protein